MHSLATVPAPDHHSWTSTAREEIYRPENRGLTTKFDPIYRPRLPSIGSTRPEWRSRAAAEGDIEQDRQLAVA
jgi:hypothetical protein